MVEVLGRYCTEHFAVDPPKQVPLIIKSQKRTPRDLLTPEEFEAPHPAPHHAYGRTYGEHREFLELSVDDHRRLQRKAGEFGIPYTCSVWDLKAAQDVISLYPPCIKIPSACNLDFEMIGKIGGAYEGELHISLGMTTRAEVEKIVSFVERIGISKRTVLYACTSGYPVPFDQTYLLEISRLRQVYGHRVKGIGFSGHHNGIAVDMVAGTLGARWIERHFTLNRTWRGRDHAASLEPEGMRKLLRNLWTLDAVLRDKPPELAPIEVLERKHLKRKATDRVIPPEIKAKEATAA
jgi:sialic acid synthase